MSKGKPELRERLKQGRLAMSDAQRTLKSREIVRKLKESIEWPGVKTLHYYEPIKNLVEVDISGLVTYLEDTYPDMKLFTPRLIGKKWQMVAARGGNVPPQFDAVIVPMLGFDSRLHRIGYGGGYYDKFLATQPAAQKIGVCFESGIIDEIPIETHDIPLDLIITEKTVYEN
jgi:5-formyltetrahydrofolate cyclo-ligase